MEKVLITGNAGSGKTTFSASLKQELNLPTYSLDSIIWKPGWKIAPDEERREKILKLAFNDVWIIDGVSRALFEAADTVFFLDIPLYRCLGNIIKRFLSNGFKTRESLPENCPEYIGVFKAFRIAFIYQKNTRPAILQMIQSFPKKKIIWIKNYGQLSAWKTMIN